MSLILNALYLCAWSFFSPVLLYKRLRHGKYRRGMGEKLVGMRNHPSLADAHDRGDQVVWFHGVSVGEVHLLRQIVKSFRERFPRRQCVISATTETGYDEAKKHFLDLPVVWWPFDFTWSVRRGFDIVRPSFVVLAEGEIWPNFLREATRRHVPVAVVNGRLSPRSAARLSRLRWLMAPIFRRLRLVCAQSEEFAGAYLSLGVQDVVVTGNVKYDGVDASRDRAKTSALAELFHIGADRLVLVAGSTQDPEERLLVESYARLREKFPSLRLILVPRHPERFDEVAAMLQRSGQPFVRRSQLTGPCSAADIVLCDSMGELSALWGLADIAYVGGSLDGKRGGQNMIEPAARGAATLFGPHTWNFKEAVRLLLAHAAAIEVADGNALYEALDRLLADAGERKRLGKAARDFVASQQGATLKTLDALATLIESAVPGRAAA